MDDFDPLNHCWLMPDDTVFSSARMDFFPIYDRLYLIWKDQNGEATLCPMNEDGERTIEALDVVLNSYGLSRFPRTPAEQRRAAFIDEADSLRDEISGYREEADALREAGDEDAAAEVEGWARNKRARWLDIRRQIRERFPDTVYRLNPTGTYHLPTCSYAGENGETLTLDAIRQANPNAKPCSRCNPPALQ